MRKAGNRQRAFKSRGICEHCGGIIRYYMGSVSCLLCGRDMGHKCQDCSGAVPHLKKSA